MRQLESTTRLRIIFREIRNVKISRFRNFDPRAILSPNYRRNQQAGPGTGIGTCGIGTGASRLYRDEMEIRFAPFVFMGRSRSVNSFDRENSYALKILFVLLNEGVRVLLFLRRWVFFDGFVMTFDERGSGNVFYLGYFLEKIWR